MASVAWIVPSPTEGGGGYRTIVRKARALRERGHENVFYLVPNEDYRPTDPSLVADRIERWFGFRPDDVRFRPEVDAAHDAVVATSWDTASLAASAPCAAKAYFVQDWEPWFFPMGAARIVAEQSYSLGLAPIVLGRWLARRLRRKTGARPAVCDFGVDLDVYRPTGDVARERAVCAIWQPEKDRRIAPILRQALRIVADLDDEVTVVTYGSAEGPFPGDRRFRHLGLLSVEERSALYRRCRCGVSMSSSNPSRIPFEMMAAGLPVVDLHRENNLHDFADGCVALAEPTPAGIASAVLDLLDDEGACARMGEAARAWVAGRDIEREDGAFCDALEALVEGRDWDEGETGRTYAAAPRPLREDCVARQRELEARERREVVLARTAVRANRLDVRLDPGPADEVVASSVAVWSGMSQDDLRWVDLAREEDGAWRTVIPLPARPDAPTIWHAHLYVTRRGQEAACEARWWQFVDEAGRAGCTHEQPLSDGGAARSGFDAGPVETEDVGRERGGIRSLLARFGRS